MRKQYVLDTSVLVHDANAFKSFSGNDVIIPVNVLDELDKLKTFPNEAGKNARVCIRALDLICSQGEIHNGIKIDNDITIKVDASVHPDKFGTPGYVDNKILSCAYFLKEKLKKKKIPVILVSKDINLRIRAQVFEIQSEDYDKDKIPASDLYSGFQEIQSDEIGKALQQKNSIEVCQYDELKSMLPNECVHFSSEDGRGLSMGRRVGDKIFSVKNKKPWGLELRNKEQAFAADLLCDPKVPLVSLIGAAGTGKSLVAIASALEMVLEKKVYQKLIIYRPMQTMEGQDVGFLPGDLSQKLGPHYQAVEDTMEYLFSSNKGEHWKAMLDLYIERGLIQLDALAYIRGRSIPNAFIIIDEAQNLSLNNLKTILTRCSDNTKMVIIGDIQQIDNKHLDASDNGLVHIAEKFKSETLSGHITLSKGERSNLAALAAKLL